MRMRRLWRRASAKLSGGRAGDVDPVSRWVDEQRPLGILLHQLSFVAAGLDARALRELLELVGRLLQLPLASSISVGFPRWLD